LFQQGFSILNPPALAELITVVANSVANNAVFTIFLPLVGHELPCVQSHHATEWFCEIVPKICSFGPKSSPGTGTATSAENGSNEQMFGAK
jgi:hypothetical protein